MSAVIDYLRDGHSRFQEIFQAEHREMYEELATKGQFPKALVISCVDARVDPAQMFQTKPGDLLMLRNVANLVEPFPGDVAVAAFLEFGVNALGIKELIILGHSQCGGVKAMLDTELTKEKSWVKNWMSPMHDVWANNPDSHSDVDQCAKLFSEQSKANCMTYPWLKEKVDAGEFHIHTAFFDIHTGKVSGI